MTDFILILLAGIGFSHILADSSIATMFKTWLMGRSIGPRLTWWRQKFLDMSNCYQCNGFWTGGIVGLIGVLGFGHSVWTIPLWAFANSFVALIAGYFKFWFSNLASGDIINDEDNEE